MDFQNSKDNFGSKFVCPSDRQLALRAKLRTGWSTARLNGPLRPEEQAAITAVIRRNEDVESAERQRVGRLVERVEKIKQRAAEYGPHNCRLCGTAFGLLGPSKRLCEDCRKPVCSKCSIEISSKGYRLREVWLCKICSETREMWKKSGAWFFKGLPRYEIPSKCLKQPIKPIEEMEPKPTKTTKLGMEIENSSSEEENDNETVKARSSIVSRTESIRLRTIGSFRSFFNRQQSNSEANKLDWHSASINSVTNYRENNTRRGSLYSNLSVSEPLFGQNNQTNHINQVYREPPLGWLELSLVYNEVYHTLDCTILRARDLPPMDNTDLADPFCKLNIITPEKKTKQTQWLRTKTFHKTRNPEINENLTILSVKPQEIENSTLYVVFFDDDKYGHDFLGTAKIDLSPVLKSPYKISVPLGAEDQYSIEAACSESWSRGQILIALSYNTKKRALIVTIKKCANLLPMDSNGSSDPFIKLQLKPDYHRRKYKTSVKWRNLNPIYNEEFQFETRPNDLNKQSLIITVWDKDIGKSNDFLGSLILGYSSKGRRLKQWIDCVRLPDHFHEQWHYLSSDLP